MAKMLTAAAVKNHAPGPARREVPDGGTHGLYLVIQPSGAKSWAVRIRRPNGKTAKLTLGPVDLSGRQIEGDLVIGQPLSLVAARSLAAAVHHQRAMGRDVISDRDAAKRRRAFERQDRAANNFAAAARDYIAGHAMKKARRWQEQARVLGFRPTADGLDIIRGGLAERWADRAVAEVDTHDVFAVVDEARRLGVPGLKRRKDGPNKSRAMVVHATLSRMFGWLTKNRRVEKNPCSGLHKPDQPSPRDRVLTDAEIKKFWSACDAASEPFGAALKLLLLTGCRRNEVVSMRHAELSEDGMVWTIPSERTKNKRVHVVPLSPTARDILKSVKSLGGPLLFTTSGQTQISGFSKVKQRLDEAMEIAPWRIHDLRRTAATGMADIGIAPHVVEAVLNHVSGSKAGVAGVYNRAAYGPEKRVALERWAAHIKGIVAGKPADVVSLRSAS